MTQVRPAKVVLESLQVRLSMSWRLFLKYKAALFFLTLQDVFPADGLLLLLVANVVGLGRDQVDELGAAVQDQLPGSNCGIT